MTVTENDIINNAAAIATLVNGAPTDKTIGDLDAAASMADGDFLHTQVSGVDKKITRSNAMTDYLAKSELDDTPADDAETAVTSKFIFDNLNGGPYLPIANIDDTPADDADTAVSSKWIYDNISSAFKVKTSSAKSANYTVTDADGIETILMTTDSSTDKTVTLPTVADNTDREITIMKVDNGTNYCIADGEGAETINGVSTVSLYKQYDYIKVKSDGTQWHIIDEKISLMVFIVGQAASTTTNPVIFSTTVHENTGTVYNTSTGIFTAPTDGIYQFNVISLPAGNDNAYFNINGTVYQMNSYNASTRSDVTFGIRMTAAQTGYFRFSGGASADAISSIQIYKVG